MPFPTEQRWLEISELFWECCNFPNFIGATDEKHICVIMPPDSGSRFFNYKKYFSIVPPYSQTPLIRPYGQRSLNHKKRVFNYRLSRARRMVECTFGILASNGALSTPAMQLSPEKAVSFVKAACVLHNFVRVRDGYT